MNSYREFSDSALVALLVKGDQLAYTEIYNRYKKLLYGFALKRLDDEDEVEDILHELFLSLWTKREKLNDEVILAPYLYGAIRNQIINIFSRRKISARYLDSFNHYIQYEFKADETDHLIRHKELSALIEKEIAVLPLKMREVFELSRRVGYTRKQIAAELSISEETVKSHMHHALKILKVKLGSLMVFVFF